MLSMTWCDWDDAATASAREPRGDRRPRRRTPAPPLGRTASAVTENIRDRPPPHRRPDAAAGPLAETAGPARCRGGARTAGPRGVGRTAPAVHPADRARAVRGVRRLPDRGPR